MTAIPIIDLAPVQAGAEDTGAIAGQLLDAFRGYGFAYIKNHGIPPAIIDEAFQRSRDFFALSAAAKAQCARPAVPAHQRGYSGPSREKLSQIPVFDRAAIAQRRRVPDVKESFDIGRDDDADDDDDGAGHCNVWPGEGRVPGFRDFWMGFFARMGVLEGQVLRLVGEGLRLHTSTRTRTCHGGGVGADPSTPHVDGRAGGDASTSAATSADADAPVDADADADGNAVADVVASMRNGRRREEADTGSRVEAETTGDKPGGGKKNTKKQEEGEEEGEEGEEEEEEEELEGYLARCHSRMDNQIRLLHYPPVEVETLQQGRAERIAAHTDFGTLTMLFQDEVGGLEVEHPDEPGRFVRVPPAPGTVVVNVGDLLMRWSNDLLKSTMHRVGMPSSSSSSSSSDPNRQGGTVEARYSIAYFCAADKDRVVDCLPGCVGPARPRRYSPIRSGEYVDLRMAAIS